VARYLLAAEADKIQEFLFRSTRLVQVIGGSAFLSRFCQEEAPLLLGKIGVDTNDCIIIADGGTFRLQFDNKEIAAQCGELLAEYYSRALGGTLTIAEPVEVIDNDFHKAQQEVQSKLVEAKIRRRYPVTSAHMSFMAFCASCGMGLAGEYMEDNKYLCPSCAQKENERRREFKSFVHSFYQLVNDQVKEMNNDLISEKIFNPDPVKELERLQGLDAGGYIAYLVADGNDMGMLFDDCKNPQQMRKFSEGLSKSLEEALANSAALGLNYLYNKQTYTDKLPVPIYPAILGGDDCLAVMAAPIALSMTENFCRVFSVKMKNVVDKGKLGGKRPGISAALVYCKANYPYALAYQRGLALLSEAKRLARISQDGDGHPQLTINFEVISGDGLEPEYISGAKHRNSVRPYFVGEPPKDYLGLDIKTLHESRYQGDSFSSQRLNSLRRLFDNINFDDRQREKQWDEQFAYLKKRVARNPSESIALENILHELGGGENSPWRSVRRENDKYYACGLSDLIEMWDFLEKVTGNEL
jgi:predicted RNA-binding Zn-ribbon protein involved in translation (DUF1610 family)